MRRSELKLVIAIGLAVGMSALSACSSMSANQCLATDWRTVGYEDGVAGYSGSRIGKYRNACSEHGISPDLSEYQSGREQGLREYCKPVNGFRKGSRGGAYNGVCPAELEDAFMSAYQSGRQLHTLRSRVGSTAQEIDSMRAELNQIDKDLVSTGVKILDPSITHARRAELLVDSKHMAERKGEINALLPQMEQELAAHQRELDDYRATLQYAE